MTLSGLVFVTPPHVKFMELAVLSMGCINLLHMSGTDCLSLHIVVSCAVLRCFMFLCYLFQCVSTLTHHEETCSIFFINMMFREIANWLHQLKGFPIK